jgi:hypothetical protein
MFEDDALFNPIGISRKIITSNYRGWWNMQSRSREEFPMHIPTEEPEAWVMICRGGPRHLPSPMLLSVVCRLCSFRNLYAVAMYMRLYLWPMMQRKPANGNEIL